MPGSMVCVAQEKRGSVRKLGVITAMDEECTLLRESLTHAKVSSIGPRTFFEGTLNGQEVVLVCSRIGKVAAATTVTSLIASFGVDAVVFTGVAGGIAPDVSIGDIVVAQHLVQHDFDIKGLLGCPRFSIPLLGMSHIPSCEELTPLAERAAYSVVLNDRYQKAVEPFASRPPVLRRGLLASGDVFVSSNEERESLRAALPEILCVEMEGAAVAQVCVEHDIPFVVTRVISDGADDSSIQDFGAFVRSAAAIGSEMFVRAFIEELK